MTKSRGIWIVTVDEPLFYGRMYCRIIDAAPEMIAGIVVLPHPSGAGLGNWLSEALYRLRFWGLKALLAASAQLFWAKFRGAGDVIRAGRTAGIDVWREPDLRSAMSIFKTRQPEVVLASVTSRIPSEILSLASLGWVNTHCGPLPRYGGFDAPFWCLYNREPTLSVTLHYMAEGIDEGPIIAQRSIPVGTQPYFQLVHRLFDLAYEMHLNCLNGNWPKMIDALPQDLSQRTYFTKPSAELGRKFRRRGGRFA